MMVEENNQTEFGTVKIHKESIAAIAALAACEIQGVKAIDKGILAGIFELLGKKRIGAIKVEFDKQGEVLLEIPLVITYGYSIPEVAAKVQENVRNNVEKMTHLYVRDITINVRSIEKI
ncbi:MAG: Asp23/Gls24 family envelope stress response protein [Candidatus Omnitrophica bacterium]|nr:Asp23/Gls24 family envelope stress response protein [Candidatus Omnitrophota bacterium]